jgi:hypothetical protein
MAETRVGYWYATGPADKQYTSGDPDFNLHTVISDRSQFVAHVTVENAGKQRFPVPCSLIDEIAAPPGPIYFPLRAEVGRDAENRRCVRPQERPLAIPATPGTSQIVDFYPHWDVAASG